MKLKKVQRLAEEVRRIYDAECALIGEERVKNLSTLSLFIERLPNQPLDYLVVAMNVAEVPNT